MRCDGEGDMTMTRAWVPAAVVASMTVLAAGCASTTVDDQRWEGHRIKELIASIGPADRIVSYPYGGTLYIWEGRGTGVDAPDSSTIDDTPRVKDFVTSRVFLVDDSGIIVRTQFERGVVAPDRLADGQ